MKKFFNEFKTFITRGNVLDLAVGVIVGGAFTAIVNALSNNILKPLINLVLALILGKDGLSGILTMLKEVKVDGVVDLTQSIYIDWGAFISAIINFLLIAMVLFIIVKVMNRIAEGNKEFKEVLVKNKLTKEQRKELKANGIKLSDKEAVKEYLDKKKAEEQAKLEQEKLEKEKQAKLDRLNNPTTEDLLKKIIKLLEKKHN